MRKYLAAYALWLTGVLTAAAVAFYYYKKVIALGDDALADELRSRPPAAPSRPPQPEAEPPGFEDAESLDEARPPSFEDIRRRRGSAS